MKVIINFSNRWLYTIIAIGILAIIGVGVYAVAGVSHSADEIEEVDPTVPSSIKDGITWTEISSRPAGLDDGDDVGGADNLGNHIATQDLNLDYNKITNLNPPTSNRDAATKAYVDAQAGGGGCYWDHDSACPSGFTQKDSDVQYLCSNSVNLGSSSLHTVVLPVGEPCPSGFIGKFNLGAARLCCMS